MAIVQYYISEVPFRLPGAITVADNKWKREMQFRGEILGYRGFIKTLGTGGGTSTDIQLRNQTTTPDKDYFSTKPTFEVDSASNLLEGGELIASPTFQAGDVLVLDVDAISTGPADAEVTLLCGFFREIVP